MEISDVEKMQANKDVGGLIEALKGKDWRVRIDAAGTLGDIGDTRAVEPLIEALKDENSIVRSIVEEALGKIRK